MIPSPVLAECREKAQTILKQGKPTNRAAAVVIAGIWLLLAALAIVLAARALGD